MTRFRLGQDVMRALALGARSSMIGRAYAFGWVPAEKPASPRHSISLARKCSPPLCGVNTVAEIDDNVLAV
jgi:L-lactate dehydrogenase (cytochrome)